MKKYVSLICLFGLFLVATPQLSYAAKPKIIKTLIVDGQNNHDQWPKVTAMMKQFLEQTGLFSVDVQRTKYTWNGKDLVNQYKIPGVPATTDLAKSKMDSSFHPNFAAYDMVICNFGWNAAPWPAETQADFAGPGRAFFPLQLQDIERHFGQSRGQGGVIGVHKQPDALRAARIGPREQTGLGGRHGARGGWEGADGGK
jgi:hypothetical protein